MTSMVTTTPRGVVAPHGRVAMLVIGPLAVAIAALFSMASDVAGSGVPAWAPAAALLALAAGVPHGAVDHLALARQPVGRRRFVLATAYLAVASLAAAAVLLAPAPAFVAVLAMSVWHFGSGDVELSDELSGAVPRSRWRRTLHIMAAGSLPVLLPLTAATSAETLLALEPRLAALTAPGILLTVRVAVLVVAATACVVLLRERRVGAAAELALLVVLGLTVTPLLAFAVYFAAWHAARHTLRLALDDRGRLDRVRLRTVLRDGVPSLLVTLAVLAAALLSGSASSATVLWFALAVVWGLTVPHMTVVAAFGRRRRAARVSPARPSLAVART